MKRCLNLVLSKMEGSTSNRERKDPHEDQQNEDNGK
jgi:hypothetical protein